MNSLSTNSTLSITNLNNTFKAVGYTSEWWGRAYLTYDGGSFGVICDYRNPTGGTNAIDVVNCWGPNSANSLRISLVSNSFFQKIQYNHHKSKSRFYPSYGISQT